MASPPVRRAAASGYQGHSLLVQKEIEDDQVSKNAAPQVLLRAPRLQRAQPVNPTDLRLDRSFLPGEARVRLEPRAQHVAGYRGFQRGNKCRENLGPLEKSSELEVLLRQLSQGVNGGTFAQFDILRRVPPSGVAQELHGVQTYTPALQRGVVAFKRTQSAETAYADAYMRSQGTGPFVNKNKPAAAP